MCNVRGLHRKPSPEKDKYCWFTVTVNSEILARVLFSRNFAYAKFYENKILAEW